MMVRGLWALALLAGVGACTGRDAAASAGDGAAKAAQVTVTIASTNGKHVFQVDTAKTEPEQQRGLMYRTGIPANGGMLFHPYPPDGSGPRQASFWMKNTPSPLDIIYIRADRTIARIAENTVPFSEAPIPSGEPVSAVLEINGGKSAELGIAEGDKVTW